MSKIEMFFATNRAHEGADRSRPDRYGAKPSSDGVENLRFGRVALDGIELSEVRANMEKSIDYGTGDGVGLSAYYLSKIKDTGLEIDAVLDNLDTSRLDIQQKTSQLGSIKTFKALQRKMRKSADVLVYIHGFNVSWEEAVASAMALQTTLNANVLDEHDHEIVVVLFTWPSDGQAVPIYSYKSDRSDAEHTGGAFGRGLLKFRDFLMKARTRSRAPDGKPAGELLCDQEVHLLCHSMGNYVLQNTLKRMIEFNHGMRLPRIFDHVFMCSPDVDDDVLEPGQPLGRLPELARNVTVYHNRGDVAMYVSDYTKQNPDRLGLNGAASPSLLNRKIHQIDCSDIVTGAVEHSYYLNGNVNRDIGYSIAGAEQSDPARNRSVRHNAWPNQWVLG